MKATREQIRELSELTGAAGLDKETALNISLRADDEEENRKMVKWLRENSGASAHEICEMSRQILRDRQE